MDASMPDQQTQPAPQQQAPSNSSYPQSTDESDKFAAGIIKLIHNEKTQPKIVEQLQDESVPVFLRLGSVASQIIMRMVMLVQKQAGGRKPHIQLLVKGTNFAIKELVKICKIIGVKVSDEDLAKAGKVAGDLIEGGFNGQKQGQSEVPVQPGQMQQQGTQQPGLISQGGM